MKTFKLLKAGEYMKTFTKTKHLDTRKQKIWFLLPFGVDISLSANSFVASAEQTEKVPTGVISREACGSFQCFFDEITANIS